MGNKAILRDLPSVDEVLKSPYAGGWMKSYPRRFVVDAVRQAIEQRRKLILSGAEAGVAVEVEDVARDAETLALRMSSFSLRAVINATGIVIHTNLGRSPLSDSVLQNVVDAARGYSNLEYDLDEGKRGKRHIHIKRLLTDITGAEDGLAVNNNAGAVLIALNALSKGRETVVSRGELVEIGGSFRVPDVMAASGAVLKEVGTTNKTHLRDYARAINENTALILKVHRSNYRISGFTSDVPIEELVSLGRRHNVPVMYDLGSGCLIDLSAYGIPDEPSVQSIVKTGADIITFSGDKLLGGPQAGVIVGLSSYMEEIRRNPLARALRIDKLTLSALEATLMEYADPERAIKNIPALAMLLEEPASIKRRAKRLLNILQKNALDAELSLVEDSSFSGGGALPDVGFKTHAVSIRPRGMSVNALESGLRKATPPVIARIKDDALLLDARTIRNKEIKPLASSVIDALSRAA